MKRDVLRQLVRVQQRAIWRGSRYWMAVAERLQAGDLSMDTWLTAYTEYVDASIDDLHALVRLYGQDKTSASEGSQQTTTGDGKGATHG